MFDQIGSWLESGYEYLKRVLGEVREAVAGASEEILAVGQTPPDGGSGNGDSGGSPLLLLLIVIFIIFALLKD